MMRADPSTLRISISNCTVFSNAVFLRRGADYRGVAVTSIAVVVHVPLFGLELRCVLDEDGEDEGPVGF